VFIFHNVEYVIANYSYSDAYANDTK